MSREIFSFLGKLYHLVISLLLIAFLAAVAGLLWLAYEDEVFQNRFLNEGREVQVRVQDVDAQQRSWRDRFGNSRYITFPYHQKTYTTRITLDSTWVSAGDPIKLLYHPELDRFRQIHVEQKSNRIVSRLVNWSVVQGFSKEHKLLLGFLAIATAVFFFVGGLIVQLTGWTFIQLLARWALLGILGIAAVFFTYDTYNYFQYCERLRKSSQPMPVTILETDRDQIGRGNTQNAFFDLYNYDATFRYRNQNRVIVIQEDDYERLRPNDPLTVLYSPALDDFMLPNYSGGSSRLVLPLFFWALFLGLLWQTFASKKPVPTQSRERA